MRYRACYLSAVRSPSAGREETIADEHVGAFGLLVALGHFFTFPVDTTSLPKLRLNRVTLRQGLKVSRAFASS